MRILRKIVASKPNTFGMWRVDIVAEYTNGERFITLHKFYTKMAAVKFAQNIAEVMDIAWEIAGAPND